MGNQAVAAPKPFLSGALSYETARHSQVLAADVELRVARGTADRVPCGGTCVEDSHSPDAIRAADSESLVLLDPFRLEPHEIPSLGAELYCDQMNW